MDHRKAPKSRNLALPVFFLLFLTLPDLPHEGWSQFLQHLLCQKHRPKAPTFSSVENEEQKINHYSSPELFRTLKVLPKSPDADSSCFREPLHRTHWPPFGITLCNPSLGNSSYLFHQKSTGDGKPILMEVYFSGSVGRGDYSCPRVRAQTRSTSKFGVCENRYLHATTTTTTTTLCSSGHSCSPMNLSRRVVVLAHRRSGVTQWTCVQLTPIHRTRTKKSAKVSERRRL